MKGIMFNTKYGLEQAVLNGTKTRTWQAFEDLINKLNGKGYWESNPDG